MRVPVNPFIQLWKLNRAHVTQDGKDALYSCWCQKFQMFLMLDAHPILVDGYPQIKMSSKLTHAF